MTREKRVQSRGQKEEEREKKKKKKKSKSTGAIFWPIKVQNKN